MAKVVGAELLVRHAWTSVSCGCDVFGDQTLHGVGAESATAPGGEQGVVGFTVTFGQPGPQKLDRRLVEGSVSAFAALAQALDVRGGAELDVAAAQPGELGEA